MLKLIIPMGVLIVVAACNAPKQDMPAETPKPMAAVELGDSAKIKTCKDGLMALSAGNIDAFAANMTDDAVYAWNYGDSIAGKAAIMDYWKDRRMNVIDKLEVKNDIWLSLKVNKWSQVGAGDYVLLWALVTATYKGGKSMTQEIHNIYYFDKAGKINRVTQFIDRASIAAAMPAPKKK